MDKDKIKHVFGKCPQKQKGDNCSMKCPKCGNEVTDSAKFCTKCGVNIPEMLEEKARIEAEEIARKKAEEERIEAEKADKKAEEPAFIEAKKVDETEKEEVKEAQKKEKTATSEKRSNPKKKHTGLKIFFVFILILIIICAGTYGLYEIDLLPESVYNVSAPIFETVKDWLGIGKKDNTENEKEEKTEKETNKKDNSEKDDKKHKKIKKIDEDEDLVIDYYNKTLLENTYKVPEFNLDSDYAKKSNKAIKKLVDTDLKKLEKETTIPEMSPTSMNYIWAQNDNILSLVFCISGYHINYYYVYNIDVYTGEKIENQDILKAAKIDKKEFASNCSKAVIDYYENYLYDEDIEKSTEVQNELKKLKEESAKESNFDVLKTDMFLDKNGELTIIAKLNTLAGAGVAYSPVNIENLKRNSKPLLNK